LFVILIKCVEDAQNSEQKSIFNSVRGPYTLAVLALQREKNLGRVV